MGETMVADGQDQTAQLASQNKVFIIIIFQLRRGLSLRSSLVKRNTGCLSSICSHSCLSANGFGHGVATQQLRRKQADMERSQVFVFKLLVCQTWGGIHDNQTQGQSQIS